jgi:hypothetical protein
MGNWKDQLMTYQKGERESIVNTWQCGIEHNNILYTHSQWRSQKFSLGGAIGQFWLKSLINNKHSKNKC